MFFLCYNSRVKSKRKAGQAMLEYMLVFAALLGLTAVMGYFLTAARTQSARTETLVRSDYP